MKLLLRSVVMCALIVGGIEWAFRACGGMPSVVPGMTDVEFRWKLRRQSAEPRVYVVGDSRVGWGFAEKRLNDALNSSGQTSLRAVNAGLPATSVSSIIQLLLKSQVTRGPAMLILNYSPAGFYHFGPRPARYAMDVKAQDYLDEKIRAIIKQYLYTFDQPWQHVARQLLWLQKLHEIPRTIGVTERRVYEDGFVNGFLRYSDGSPVDPASFQLDYYRAIIPQIEGEMSSSLLRKAEIYSLVQQAHSMGWIVALVRLPVGARMREVEAALPLELQPETLAKEMGIPWVDYGTTPEGQRLATQDESHLTPDSARAAALMLANDVRRWYSHHESSGALR